MCVCLCDSHVCTCVYEGEEGGCESVLLWAYECINVGSVCTVVNIQPI